MKTTLKLYIYTESVVFCYNSIINDGGDGMNNEIIVVVIFFVILISIQYTLNKILSEMREIKRIISMTRNKDNKL